MGSPYLAASLVVLLAACSSPAGPQPSPSPDSSESSSPRSFESARVANLAAWSADRDRLGSDAEAVGRWIVYSGGEFRGAWDELDDAWSATEGADHALLFRPGIDDQDVVFPLSPFLNDNPRWTQLGTRLWGQFHLTIEAAGNVWHRRDGGRILTHAWGDAGVRAELTSMDGTRSVGTATVPSGLFEHELSLTEDQAEALDLGRIEAPGRAWYGSQEWPCRKVVLRVRIPELDIDVPAVGFVLPRELTDRMAMPSPEFSPGFAPVRPKSCPVDELVSIARSRSLCTTSSIDRHR